MLLPNLYTCQSKQLDEAGKLHFSIHINKDHSVFEGHFPGIPILPGVCQTQIVKELLEEHIGKSLQLKSARAIKFFAMINPLNACDINVSIGFKTNEDGGLSVDATLFDEQSKYLKLTADYSYNG